MWLLRFKFDMSRMKIALLIFTIFSIYLISVSGGQEHGDNLLYPWGKDNGDQSGKRHLMVYFNNTEKVRYFRKSYSNVSLCPGGRIGFAADYGFLCGRDASQKGAVNGKIYKWTNIAIFGVTHNLEANGSDPEDVYREYLYYKHFQYYGLPERPSVNFDVETMWYRTSKDPPLLKKAARDVQKNFPTCNRSFKPKELFIVTWTGADDIDFCEAHQIGEPVCSCMIYDSPIRPYRRADEYFPNASYLYCYCLTIMKKSHRLCMCHASYGDLFFDYTVPYDWCACVEDYGYTEEYCDCYVYDKCSNNSDIDKRDVPVKRDLQEETNTYQIVLMSDGRQTYAMFNYLDIDWIYINTFYILQLLRYEWDPIRVFAEVGFEQENGSSYHHPYSASDDLYKLVNETNTDRPGRWMYKISGRRVISPGCGRLLFDHEYIPRWWSHN